LAAVFCPKNNGFVRVGAAAPWLVRLRS